MAFENVFGNIDFGAPARARQAEAAQFQQAIGNAVSMYNQKQARDQRLKEIEAANAGKMPDINKAAQNAILKANMGMELTPQDQAFIQTAAQTKADQVYFDEYNRQVVKPNPFKAYMGEAGISTTRTNPDSMQILAGAGDQRTQAMIDNASRMNSPAIDGVNPGMALPTGQPKPIVDDIGVTDVPYLSPEQFETYKATGQLAGTPKGELMEAESAQMAVEEGVKTLGAGQKELDKQFIKDVYTPFKTGGFASVQKQISDLDSVVSALKSKDITGGVKGYLPTTVRAVGAPESVDIQETAENVIQRSLRETLGAQFTEKEASRLIDRGYNPRLDESVNARRISALKDSLLEAAQAKQDAINYYDKYGTLKGWQGTMPSFDSIGQSFDQKIETSSITREEALQELQRRRGMQ